MAKVSLNKLAPIKSGEIKEIIFNNETIQVRQYLPLELKIELIERILNQSINEMNDFSYAQLKVFYAIEFIKAYTNINFTETQLKDVTKIYDLLKLNNILDIIEQNIPEQELLYIKDMLNNEVNRIRTYFHSAAGVLSIIQQDYAQTNMNVDGLLNKLQSGENFELVKDILTKVN